MANVKENFGLCLSGGGFRATLFHLGVVKFLRDAGLLKEITHIFSVSGGSILAAHLLLNWEKYNGTEDDFEEMAEEVIKFTQSDLRGRVIRKWILSWLWVFPRFICWLFKKLPILKKLGLIKRCDWRISTLLENTYSKFYQNKNLQDINKENLPQLHILSTSLTTGRLFSFNNEGVTFISDNKDARYKTYPSDDIPISKAVAASSAFPPVFSPVAISHQTLNVEVEDFPNTEYLSDGGVYDNLGIRRLFVLQELEQFNFDKIFISDAGSAFSWNLNRSYNFILSLSIRANDLLMMRVGNLEYLGLNSIKPTNNTKVAVCKIHVDLDEENDESPLSVGTQRSLWKIRTDLNTFNSWEINTLTQHGFATARKSSKELGVDTSQMNNFTWLPKITKDGWNESYNLKENMDKAVRRKWSLLSFRDLNSWLSLGMILLIILVSTFPIWLAVATLYINEELSKNNKKLNEQVEVIENGGKRLAGPSIKLLFNDNNSSIDSESIRSGIEEIFDKYKKSIVKIKVISENNQLVGSGFLVHNNGYILTADYVVGKSNASNKYFVQLDGSTEEQEAKLIDNNSSKKLALLKISGDNYQVLEFNKEKITPETPLVIIGYLMGDKISFEPGIVKEIKEPFLQVKFNKDESIGERSPGFGGGPALDTNGKVIGIYYSFNPPFRECISTSVIEDFLSEQFKKLNISYQTAL